MRKALVLLAIMSLVIGFAFADGKGDMKVGGRLGYGQETINAAIGSQKAVVLYQSFDAAGSFEYGFTDNIYAKAELGINTMGHAKVRESSETTTSTATPPNFTMYLGAEYVYDINDKFSVGGGLGLDAIMGQYIVVTDDEDQFDLRLGVGAEAVGAVKVSSEIAVLIGARFSWLFARTNEQNNASFDAIRDAGGSVFCYNFKAFVGMTYSL